MNTRRLRVTYIILIVLIVLLLAVTVFAVGVYGYDWDSTPFGEKTLRAVPLPAAVVGGKVITFAQFQASSLSLDELVEAELARRAAEANQIDLAGVSRADWKNKAAVELLRKNRDRSDAYQEIKQIALKLPDEMSFEEAVITYSQDVETRYIGGDQGLYETDEVPFWFADQIEKLETGEISDVTPSPEGYNLARVAYNGGGFVQFGRLLIREDFLTPALEEVKKSATILIAK